MARGIVLPERTWCDVCRNDSGRADKSLRFRREGSETESRGRDVKCWTCGKILATFALEDPPRRTAAERGQRRPG